MTFEFWLDDQLPTELDEYLARIDRDLDALVIEEVEDANERLGTDRAATSNDAAA